ncbi:uncharacterized protein F4822DRAFT_170951 [Hypoxylon trugodes]|uniref:uncharacterized protein n=1 Tax=Hypoxylon trugodes TaxID=326681 RepID=UPI00219858C0|nr:uncharacterized protein F4822DRAFT_170951 [Hypoxylon trugodes]KAI1391043.1 hypothetical protein F4822DRAFT_170951 [Hypoxylon trugodes]
MSGSMDNFHGFSNLGDNWQKNSSWLGASGISQAAYNSNSTFGVINQFKFLAARSIRTSTIILAAFNTVSAFAAAAGIFYDCYVATKRSNLENNTRTSVFRCLFGGPETYPFILSLSITIQGIIFAVCQSFGLDGLFIPQCSLISQFMWPAIFIVPYIQLVFGLEVFYRATRSEPFPPRGKWNVVICLVIVKILLVGTGLVGLFVQPPNFCFASLFWFVARWAKGGFVILVTIAVILTICSVVIFRKLTRSSMIENSERVSASRMVYYLVLAVITNALIVPFFVYLTVSTSFSDDGNSGLTLSMISTVVANLTGLTTGGLHLFLRSNTIGTIGPKNKLAKYERQKMKRQTRAGGINGMDFNGMLQPVPGPQSIAKTESQENLVDEKGNDMERGESPYYRASLQLSPRSPDPLRSNAVFEAADIPRIPEPIQVPPTPSAITHNRKPSASYTLFPSKNQGNTASVALLPPTAYNPNTQANLAPPSFPFGDPNDTLKPPPSIRPPWSRHRRDSSMASSATVQIGLRISNVADIGPMNPKVSTEAERVYDLECPQKDEPANTYRPSPLATYSALPQSPAPSRDSRMKNLPPVPAQSEEQKKDCTLSPLVYDPNSPTKSRTPSPRGVGFGVPRRANTTPVQDPPSRVPSRNRGNSSSAAEYRSDWI